MKYMFFIFLGIPRLLWAQYFFDFEKDAADTSVICPDECWEQIPESRWKCTENYPITGAYSLHHSYDNPEAGCDFISMMHDPPGTGSSNGNPDSLVCAFRVRHGYPPSSANNWQLALLTDYSIIIDENIGIIRDGMPESVEEMPESGEEVIRITEGWVLGVNYSGSDDLLKLWECRNGECDACCVTSLNYQEMVGTEAAPQFQLTWCWGDSLRILYTPNPDEVSPVQIGGYMPDTIPDGRHLIVRYKYSSAQDRKLWLDDITLDGNFRRDTTAPAIRSVVILDETHIHILFSEQITLSDDFEAFLTGPALENMASGGILQPDTVMVLQDEILLEYQERIPNRQTLDLRIAGICDTDGNCRSDTIVTLFRNDAEWGDVVFNELMFDPAPAVLLPEKEYLELYNRSGYELNLQGWSIEINNRSYPINAQLIAPETYLVIYGISLPNEGAILALYSDKGTLIHSTKYTLPWEGPDWKEEGGWSLESPDPDLPCNISDLWEYASDPSGGTPGRQNSNDADLVDHQPPQFLYHGFDKERGWINLYYSEPVHFNQEDLEQIVLDPGSFPPDTVLMGIPISDRWTLGFSDEATERTTFKFHLPAVADCSGNVLQKMLIETGRTSPAVTGSVLINEIMYDPREGSPEYIELYNPGPDQIDLQELALDVVAEGEFPLDPVPISDHSRIFPPQSYLVLTRSVPHLMEAYSLDLNGQWVEVRGMDQLQNSGGTLLLTDRNGNIVDRATFADHMHLDLLDVTQGVSLERISLGRPGNEIGNWHSAASIEGYSTPGKANSQSWQETESTRLLQVEPLVFSPDNDGYEDLLKISLLTETRGWVVTLWVSDLGGRKLKILANNHLAAPAVQYTWDGSKEDGQMTGAGIYILHARGYHPDTGEQWSKKKAIGVVYQIMY